MVPSDRIIAGVCLWEAAARKKLKFSRVLELNGTNIKQANFALLVLDVGLSARSSCAWAKKGPFDAVVSLSSSKQNHTIFRALHAWLTHV